MNYLFDVGVRRKVERPEEPEKPVAPRDESTRATPATLGGADDLFDCGYCQGRCHDVIDEYGGQWKVQCCFCGLVETVGRVEGVLPSTFTFPSGRFSGERIDAVAATPKGRKFVAWAAKEHMNQEVRAACQTFLDTSLADS
jgi:hypothetical protein